MRWTRICSKWADAWFEGAWLFSSWGVVRRGYSTRLGSFAGGAWLFNRFSFPFSAISGIVGQMKNVALDMGTELSRQNAQIEDITIKTEFTDERTSRANKAVRNELRK